jgi:hypothetical protein
LSFSTYDTRVFGSRISYALKRTAEELEIPPSAGFVREAAITCLYPAAFTYFLWQSRLLKRTEAPDGGTGYSMTIDKVISGKRTP